MSLLSLPRNIRDDIFKRVLVVRHPLYLFQDKYSAVVETFGPEIPVRWLALLYTNRQVHDEASAVLYGLNRFTLVDTTRQQVRLLQSFLNCIGSERRSTVSPMHQLPCCGECRRAIRRNLAQGRWLAQFEASPRQLHQFKDTGKFRPQRKF